MLVNSNQPFGLGPMDMIQQEDPIFWSSIQQSANSDEDPWHTLPLGEWRCCLCHCGHWMMISQLQWHTSWSGEEMHLCTAGAPSHTDWWDSLNLSPAVQSLSSFLVLPFAKQHMTNIEGAPLWCIFHSLPVNMNGGRMGSAWRPRKYRECQTDRHP